MEREEIGFTEDESRKRESLAAFKGGHFSNDRSKSKKGHFSSR